MHLPAGRIGKIVFFMVRPLFFYFLVYGFLGWKNGSVGREKKKKKIQIIK